MNSKVIAVIAGVFASFIFASAQDADTLQPGSEGKDANIHEGLPDMNFGNMVDLCIGITGGDFRYSFVEFDLTSYAGRLLDSCFLDLWCYKREKTAGSDDTAGVWRVTQSWQENTVTWNNQPGTDPVLFSSSTDGDKDTWWTWNVKDMVQEWLDGTFPNNGFIILFYFLGINSNATFYSSDAPAPGPRLRLYFKTQKSLTISSPNGGENWQAGSVHNITWTSTGSITKVNIVYTPKWSASQWYTITADYNNTGSYSWTIPNTPGNEALVQIEDAAQPGVGAFDVSDGYFTIAPASVEEAKANEAGTVSLVVHHNPAVKPIIQYRLPSQCRSSLKVYSLDGREVRDLSAFLTATSGTVIWDGYDDLGRFIPEGVYFCRLEAAGKQNTARITIIR